MNDYFEKILQANVYEVAKKTPLEKAINLSNILKNEVFLKREDLQEVFSFKIRGAYNKMSKLSKSELPPHSRLGKAVPAPGTSGPPRGRTTQTATAGTALASGLPPGLEPGRPPGVGAAPQTAVLRWRPTRSETEPCRASG